jgi:DNA-binding GntR family transcriptional regulator
MNKEILKTVRDRILFMEYPPGQLVNEKALAEEFGFSRTPVREVLNRLEWEQLVRIIPRTGAIVTEIEFQKMIHVFQIRLDIEALVGRLAAEHITEKHLGEVDAIRQNCSELLAKKDRKALVGIDLEFRRVLYDAANNPVLRDMSQYLYNLTLRLWYAVFNRGDWIEEVRSLLEEIERSHEVLTRRQPEEAGKLRRELLSGHIERIKSKF